LLAAPRDAAQISMWRWSVPQHPPSPLICECLAQISRYSMPSSTGSPSSSSGASLRSDGFVASQWRSALVWSLHRLPRRLHMRIGSRPSVSSLKELADNIPAALPPWPCAIPIASLACVIVIDLLLQPTEPVHLVPNAGPKPCVQLSDVARPIRACAGRSYAADEGALGQQGQSCRHDGT